jgi:hypothetical protein
MGLYDGDDDLTPPNPMAKTGLIAAGIVLGLVALAGGLAAVASLAGRKSEPTRRASVAIAEPQPEGRPAPDNVEPAAPAPVPPPQQPPAVVAKGNLAGGKKSGSVIAGLGDSAQEVLRHPWWKQPPTAEKLNQWVAVMADPRAGVVVADDVGRFIHLDNVTDLARVPTDRLGSRCVVFDPSVHGNPTRPGRILAVFKQLMDEELRKEKFKASLPEN